MNILINNNLLSVNCVVQPAGVLTSEDSRVIEEEINRLSNFLDSPKDVTLKEAVEKSKDCVKDASVAADKALGDFLVPVLMAGVGAVLGVIAARLMFGDNAAKVGIIIGGGIGFLLSMPILKKVK